MRPKLIKSSVCYNRAEADMKKTAILLVLLAVSLTALAFGEGKLFDKGLKAFNAGDLQTAKVFFNEALNKNPKYSRAYSYLALTQSKLGEIDDAIMNYKLAYKFDDKDYSSLTNLCGLYIDKGELTAAHEACTQALSINNGSFVALNNRCLVFLQEKRYDSAIADCSQALSFKKDYVTAYVNRGMAYTAINDYEKAAEDFTSALKYNPADATAYNNRCNAYKELKRYDEALADCSKAIVMDGTLAEAYLNRGAVYELVGKTDDAVLDYNKYLKFHPEAETVRQKINMLLKDRK